MVLPGRSSTPRIELPFGTTSVCQSRASVAAASSLDVTILIGRLLATAVIAGITPTNANWSWLDSSAGISAAPPSPTCGLIFRPSASKKPFCIPRYMGAALAIGSVPTVIVFGAEEPPLPPSELSPPPHAGSPSARATTSAAMSPPRPRLSRIASLPCRIDSRQGTPRARMTSPAAALLWLRADVARVGGSRTSPRDDPERRDRPRRADRRRAPPGASPRAQRDAAGGPSQARGRRDPALEPQRRDARDRDLRRRAAGGAGGARRPRGAERGPGCLPAPQRRRRGRCAAHAADAGRHRGCGRPNRDRRRRRYGRPQLPPGRGLPCRQPPRPTRARRDLGPADPRRGPPPRWQAARELAPSRASRHDRGGRRDGGGRRRTPARPRRRLVGRR